jgi:methyl-accepting chemotaxis protein
VVNKKTINDHFGAAAASIINAAGKSKEIPQAFYFDNSEYIVGSIESLDWYIAAILPITISDTLNSGMTILSIVMMAIIAAILIISYIFIGSLLKPMRYMVQTQDSIAANWDLARSIEFKHQDKIGTNDS